VIKKRYFTKRFDASKPKEVREASIPELRVALNLRAMGLWDYPLIIPVTHQEIPWPSMAPNKKVAPIRSGNLRVWYSQNPDFIRTNTMGFHMISWCISPNNWKSNWTLNTLFILTSWQLQYYGTSFLWVMCIRISRPEFLPIHCFFCAPRLKPWVT
jgi:hypothetical protein